MGELFLRPADGPHPQPRTADNWTKATTASFASQLRDDDNGTFVTTPQPTPSQSRYNLAFFSIEPQSLPEGARVRSIRMRGRARKTVSAHRKFVMDADLPLKDATRSGDIRAGGGKGAWHNNNSTFTLTRTPTWYEGKPAYFWQNGSYTITQSRLNSILVGFSGKEQHVRVYELGLLVEYDERPNASAVTSGAIADTASPVLAWEYGDDLEEQYAYQVRVYDDSGTLIHDSGEVVASEHFYQYPESLAPGDYSWEVRAAQEWPSKFAGPTFWSVWSSRLDISVEVINPASPSLLAVAEDHRARLDVLTNLNMMDRTHAHLENGVLPLDGLQWGDADSVVNCTITPGLTAHSGAQSMRVDFTGTNPEVYLFRRRTDVAPELEYTLSAWTLNEPGSPALDVTLTIRFVSNAGATLSTVSSPPAAQVDGVWTQHSVTGVAPVGTASALVRLNWSGGAAADAYFVDDFSIIRSDALAGFPAPVVHGDVNGGGLFPYLDDWNVLPHASTVMGESHTWVPNTSTNGSNTEVELTTAEAFTGDTSLLVRRINSTGDTDAVTAPDGLTTIPDGALWVMTAISVRSATNSRNFKLFTAQLDADGAQVASTFSEIAATSTTAWLSTQAITAVDSDAKYVKIGVVFGSVPAGEEHYVDQAQVGFSNSNALANQRRFLDGEITRDGPYTEVEYSEDGGVTWEPFTTLNPVPSGGPVTLYDHEAAKGVERVYRARNYGTVDNEFFVSPWSTSTSPVELDYTGIWLNVRGPLGSAPDTEYHYVYDGHGRSETFNDSGTSVPVAGRKYAIAAWGEQDERSFAVTVAAPAQADVDALRELARAKELLVYRDGRGRRGVGRISSPTITDGEGASGYEVSFTFELQGNQIGVND